VKGIVSISATLDISNDCKMESRVNRETEIEFTFGTWEGSVEMVFARYALERFVELAGKALEAPVPAGPKEPPTTLLSPPSEIQSVEPEEGWELSDAG
jgi:hypothetical protein